MESLGTAGWCGYFPRAIGQWNKIVPLRKFCFEVAGATIGRPGLSADKFSDQNSVIKMKREKKSKERRGERVRLAASLCQTSKFGDCISWLKICCPGLCRNQAGFHKVLAGKRRKMRFRFETIALRGRKSPAKALSFRELPRRKGRLYNQRPLRSAAGFIFYI